MKLDSKSRRRVPHAETLALWKRYRETNDPALRNRIVLTFAPLVKYIVYNKIRELPARCEVDDFISCGLEALINSIERYDPSKGATLEQYAWTRIHGAVLDELRRQDWAPRSLRRWERDIQRARDRFATSHGRRPTTEELASAVGTTAAELRSRQDEIVASDLTSLNSLVLSDEETSVERIDTLASSDRGADPEHVAMSEAAKVRFRRAFAALPDREREVAVLLYVKNLTLREIGDILDVSESRVCQIHGELKRKLRESLQSESDLFSEVA
jgi:RNA polymerase sigma factor for flagellar operon FliA